MVDHKSATYRPRRAFIEPDVEPAQPERTAQAGGNGKGADRPPVVDDDQPKPLYRDDTGHNGWSRPASRAAAAPTDPPTAETMRPIALAPRRPRPVDDETTTILPRSRPTKHRTQALDAIDDYDGGERNPLGRRTKLALILGAVAVVVVIGLIVGYAVLSADDQPQSQPSGGPSQSQPPGQTETALLTDATMLDSGQAKALDRDRTWKVDSTERNPSEDAPTAACFGGEPMQGQPTPQQKMLRVLSSGSEKNPQALHEAMAYNTPEDAIQAYTIASRTLGGCAVAGSYIESGYSVSGVGNQAAGVVVMVANGSKTRAHSVILNRTGRVVNVVDAAQPSKALAMTAVAKALEQVNKAQCGPAGGECEGTPSVKGGPPPMGGDEPGFLAFGDLPPAGPKVSPWAATPIELPTAEFKGSGCENVNWETVKAESKSSRVYLLQDSGQNFFGVNEITLTTKDPKAASKLVGQFKSDLTACKKSKLTARVSKPQKITSIGAQNTKITGWTAFVTQKSTQGTAKYRVGIVAAGPKFVYTFLNPKGEYDFTGHQWKTVAARAGERATQVS